MAVTLDLRDDPNGIHPRYIAYGKQIEFQGPIVKNVVYSNGSGTVNISYTAVSNIELRNPNGFEVEIFLFHYWNNFWDFNLGLLQRWSMFEWLFLGSINNDNGK